MVAWSTTEGKVGGMIHWASSSLGGGDGGKLCRPGHKDDYNAGIAHDLGADLCHGLMDLDILFVVERERNVHVHSAFIPRSHNGSIGEVRIVLFHPLKLAPCGRTVLVDLVPDSPPIRTGHDGQRIGDESLGLTSAVLPAWAVSWALTTPRPLCLLAGYLVAGHNVPA